MNRASVDAWGLTALAAWLKGEPIAERPPHSWKEVWLWAARHRCRGLLLRSVAEAPWFAEADKCALQQATLTLGIHTMSQVVECRRLLRYLRERGIRVLFFKGVALGLRLYGDAAARSGGDIDCLVAPGAASEALTCLNALGYEPSRLSIAEIRSAWKPLSVFDNHLALVNRENAVRFELHWRLFREHCSLESLIQDALESDCARSTSEGCLPSMPPVHCFLYLIEHGAKHGFYSAQWLVDIVVQWRRLTARERCEARRLLERHALERKLALAGEMAHKFLEVEPSNEGWPLARPAPRFAVEFASKGFRADDPLAHIGTRWHFENLCSQLALSGTWRRRMSFLFFSTITTPTLMRHRLPSGLIYLYPFIRLATFAWRFARKILGFRPFAYSRSNQNTHATT